MTSEQVTKVFIITLVVWLLLALTLRCNAATAKRHGNSLGVPMYQTNPYTYQAGSISQVFDVREGKAVVVRIQPLSTYSLYTEDLLFCGQPVEMFEGKSNPVVLTYEIATHRAIEGVGCHKLMSVREIKHDDFKP